MAIFSIYSPTLSLIHRRTQTLTQLKDVQAHVREIAILNLIYFPLTKYSDVTSFRLNVYANDEQNC